MQKLNKTFCYRVNANNLAISNAENWLNLCRNLYNTCLEQRIITYKSHRRSIHKFEQMHQLVELKQAFPEYRQVDAQCLQNVVDRLAKAFDGFFRRVEKGDKPGFPRFKSKNRYDSFTLRQTGWRLQGKYLTIRNIGTFKLRLSRLIEGDIKTVTIKCDSCDKWYASFSCENVPMNPLSATDKMIGIDIGLENFATLSDGSIIENPRYFKNGHELLKRRQQSLSRKVKGSNRRNKARILVAKSHEKIRNQRKDFHYKAVNALLREYGTICIEDMKSWNGWRSLNKSMRDASWFQFFNILCFKAEEASRMVIKVPAKGTSQRCSQCGEIVPKELSVRIHSCPHCGLIIHRDYNSALNILQAGQACHSLSAPASEYHL